MDSSIEYQKIVELISLRMGLSFNAHRGKTSPGDTDAIAHA